MHKQHNYNVCTKHCNCPDKPASNQQLKPLTASLQGTSARTKKKKIHKREDGHVKKILEEANNQNETMDTLIIADSRGQGLQQLLNEIAGIGKPTVTTHRGAGIIKAIEQSQEIIAKIKPNIIILMVGICDITTKDPRTKLIQLKSNTTKETTEALTTTLQSGYMKLKTQSPRSTISIATIPGLDISDCNNQRRRHMTESEYRQYTKTRKITHPSQRSLDEAITEINRRITALNEKNEAPTTWIAGTIHPHYRKKRHNHYDRLLDGCHATKVTRTKWAQLIEKTIRNIQTTTGSED